MKFIFSILIIFLFYNTSLQAADLTIMDEGTPHAYLSLDNKPVLAISCSMPYLFFADSTVFNFKQWVKQQKQLGITHVTIPIPLNWQNIESYTIAHGGKVEKCIFPYYETQRLSRKFDLSRFNSLWWMRLRHYCQYLSEQGFIIQIELWDGRQLNRPQSAEKQEISWNGNFFNPINNTDSFTINLDNERCTEVYHSYFDDNLRLASLQEHLFKKVLESTFDIGTVYYDLCYQIAENQGDWEKTKVWIDESVDAMRSVWRRLNTARQFIIGIDAGKLSEYQQSWIFDNKKLNVMINSDIDVQSQVLHWKKLYLKPYCSTFLTENKTESTNVELADSYQFRNTLWYNSFILNQLTWINSTTTTFDLNENWLSLPANKQYITDLNHWQTFWNQFVNYTELDFQGRISAQKSKIKLVQSSVNESALFLSAGINNADKIIKAERISIDKTLLENGSYTAEFWDPLLGIIDNQDVTVNQGEFKLNVPEYNGCIAVRLFKQKQ